MPTAATGTRTISGSVAKLPFRGKVENRVLENQGLASPNFPVFGNLLQSRFLCIKAMLSQEFSGVVVPRTMGLLSTCKQTSYCGRLAGRDDAMRLTRLGSLSAGPEC